MFLKESSYRSASSTLMAHSKKKNPEDETLISYIRVYKVYD
jgi:hypothetical protein